jgi:DeoR/GlpR family transcriptional regulator of sugar metabolism
MDYLRAHPCIDVPTCRERFGVSDMTAWRDLSALTTRHLVMRVGRARNSKYIATNPSGGPS